MISIKIHENGFKKIFEFLSNYIKENTMCKINDGYEGVEIYIEKSFDDVLAVSQRSNIFTIKVPDDIVNKEFLKNVCKEIFKQYNIDSLDYDTTIKDINFMDDKEEKLRANYDKTDTAFFKDKNEAIVGVHTSRRAKGSEYYIVKRKFSEEEEAKYTGFSLVKAVTECDKHTGMCVYNENGKLIYKSTRNKITPTQNYSGHISQRAIIDIPTGIYVSNGIKRFHVSNGTEVIITKIHNTKTEIIVTIAGEKFKTEVNSSILKYF